MKKLKLNRNNIFLLFICAPYWLLSCKGNSKPDSSNINIGSKFMVDLVKINHVQIGDSNYIDSEIIISSADTTVNLISSYSKGYVFDSIPIYLHGERIGRERTVEGKPFKVWRYYLIKPRGVSFSYLKSKMEFCIKNGFKLEFKNGNLNIDSIADGANVLIDSQFQMF